MERRNFIPVLAGVPFLALCTCTTLPVTTDSNPNASVSSCHSYTFAQEHAGAGGQPAAFGNPLNADRVRAAIDANIASKVIQRAADRTSADCVVGYAIGSRQVFSDFYGGYGPGWGYGWRRRGFGGWGYGGMAVSDEMRIAMDLLSAQTRVAIWHATVNLNASDLTGANAEVNINLGVAAIFAKWPVPAPIPIRPAGGVT